MQGDDPQKPERPLDGLVQRSGIHRGVVRSHQRSGLRFLLFFTGRLYARGSPGPSQARAAPGYPADPQPVSQQRKKRQGGIQFFANSPMPGGWILRERFSSASRPGSPSPTAFTGPAWIIYESSRIRPCTKSHGEKASCLRKPGFAHDPPSVSRALLSRAGSRTQDRLFRAFASLPGKGIR